MILNVVFELLWKNFELLTTAPPSVFLMSLCVVSITKHILKQIFKFTNLVFFILFCVQCFRLRHREYELGGYLQLTQRRHWGNPELQRSQSGRHERTSPKAGGRGGWLWSNLGFRYFFLFIYHPFLSFFFCLFFFQKIVLVHCMWPQHGMCSTAYVCILLNFKVDCFFLEDFSLFLESNLTALNVILTT